ncbi:MAG TPA: glycoside hydrolase family 3 protein [Bryobacteraceae bacterium]|nr:glycoside hydrolase family 3 protein [Bryobacteraceae bacterium]
MNRRTIFAVLFLTFVVAVLCRITAVAEAPRALSSYDPQIKPIVAQMTLEEKVGQMTQADLGSLKDHDDVENYFLGSVLSGGDSDPVEGNSLEAWTNLYDRLQLHSAKTRLKIPILYGIDAVHGHNNVLGAVLFPQNIGLGATRDPALVEKTARVTAEEVRATGIQWAFGPCVTVPQDIRWGRTYEGYSEDPAVVKLLGAAAVRGLQTGDLANPLAAVGSAKHFVGDGGTAFGSSRAGRLDQGDTRVDEATLRRIHLPGYITAIQAGVATIMPSYSSWNGVKCSASKRLLTEILKQELGFQGFLISDYNAIDQISPDYKEAVAISINAGMDMAMVAGRHREFIADLKQLVEEGKVPRERIDDAVTRILRVKFAAGLMDPKRTQTADRSLWRTFGSPEHRQVARQAVRESMVLLKNRANVLPLAKTAARIHVAGKSADDLGNQCGGWTISWQGASGNGVTTGGTTILAAIRKAASKNTQVSFSRDGLGAAGASAGVVVIGETPYAEMKGDRADLALAAEDLAAVTNMKAAGIPVVALVVSGRPLVLGDVADQVDGLIAAWLPGTEGEGVADVLFGDYKPTGKLPFTWPKSMAQVPSSAIHESPLFPLGFGLSY